MEDLLRLLTSFVGLLSAIQPPFDINLPWSLGYIGIYHLGLPGETISLWFVSQHMPPRNLKFAQTPPSEGTNSHLSRVEPWRFISCAKRNLSKARVRFEQQTSCCEVECASTGSMHPVVRYWSP